MSHKKQTYNVNKGDKVVTTYEFPQKPEERSFGQFVYDSRHGTILGRTPKAWGQLTLFYIIFYIVLASLFAICLQGLFATLSNEYPKWQLDRSIIGTSPGMSFRPILKAEDLITSIKYKASSDEDVKKWVTSLNEFLAPYTNKSAQISSKRVPCDFGRPPKSGEVCKFDIDSTFGDCANNASYGFNTAKPCLYLKLNKIFGWVPEYMNNSADLPEAMPADLKAYIKQLEKDDKPALNQVWISCIPRVNETTRDIIFVGPRGFPGYFYPYTNLDGYQSPLVPIQIILEQKQIDEKRIVQIECRAWAKNIFYSNSFRDRQGSIMIDITIEK